MNKAWLAWFAAVAIASALWLIALPGTTSLYWFSDESLDQPPQGDAIHYSRLSWPLPLYQHAPELELYRSTFREHCGETREPLAAAHCFSDLLAKRFPHQSPRREMFDATYDPGEALRSHLAGAPGHCTVRAALTATVLLSIGVPARVVQVHAPEVGGHTLVEVWDEHWRVVDPSYGFTLDTSLGAATHAQQLTATQRWLEPTGVTAGIDSYSYFKSELGTRVIVPEPWLYTRVGPHQALPFYRGLFVVAGSPSWYFGVQNWLAAGLMALSSLAFSCGVVLEVRQRRRRHGRAFEVQRV